MAIKDDPYRCVQCGFCCTRAPCAYGLYSVPLRRCDYLTPDMKCSKYDEIRVNPEAAMNPAFGAGCCCSLFNSIRDAKIKELESARTNIQN